MESLLYLDTARIGRITPHAQRAFIDYLKLVGQEGGSSYFERFLRHGFADCPSWMKDAYLGLCCWNGTSSLKESLRHLVASHQDLPVLLSLRTSQLMKLAARLMFSRCENVLTTDLGWPSYSTTLETERARSNSMTTTVSVKNAVLERGATEDEVVETICRAYADNHCDGLFLSAVSNLGVRLPIARIVRRLESAHEVRFVVVDGAQDFCHLTPDIHEEYCDFYLAGCHKWFQAYHPMGLGFYGRRRSMGFIENTLSHMIANGDIDDPLIRYIREVESEQVNGYSETVNFGPLFSCQGAIADRGSTADRVAYQENQLLNLDVIAQIVKGAGWKPRLLDVGLQTGILLAQASDPALRRMEPLAMRELFRNHGVGLSTYENGYIRLSMPQSLLGQEEANHLGNALELVA